MFPIFIENLHFYINISVYKTAISSDNCLIQVISFLKLHHYCCSSNYADFTWITDKVI